MKTYISPDIKTLGLTSFMQNINNIVSNAPQLGNEGAFYQDEDPFAIMSGKSVWDD